MSTGAMGGESVGTVAFTTLFGAAMALIAMLAVELQPSAVDDQPAVPPPTLLRNASRAAAVPPGILQQAFTAILARPLFSPSRRPAAIAIASAAPPAVLPRLAGTIVHGVERSVIFTLGTGGKAVIAHEGSEVGGYTVQTIQAGRVTIAGPDGEHVLRPTFGPQTGASAQTPIGTPALPPGLAGPASLNLPGLRGFAGLPTPQFGSAR